MASLEDQMRLAVRQFWSTRGRQSVRQGAGGRKDAGSRAAVTGGKQMDGFVCVVRDALLDIGCPEASIHLGKRVELPGWFRAEKKWDLVVVHNSQLVAAVEFKSQVGPSFGNNFNNRSEEALGSATDIWAAYREGAFAPSPRPWLGFFFLLEHCSASTTPVKVSEPHFRVFPEFKDASYTDRYQLLLRKLQRDRLYDGVAFLVSDPRNGKNGEFAELDTELAAQRFVRGLASHVASVCKPNPFSS